MPKFTPSEQLAFDRALDAYQSTPRPGYCGKCDECHGDECEREIPEPRTLCDFEHEGR